MRSIEDRIVSLMDRIGLGKKQQPAPSLNEKLVQFRAEYGSRPLPAREADFSPEILVPCYNHGRFLPGLLDVLSTTGYPVTVINDCSSDDSAAVISRLKTHFSFKSIENQTNLRQHGSLNKAVRESNNNLFIVVNADDYLTPHWVDYVVRSFRETQISLLGGTNINFGNHWEQNESYVSELIKNSSHMPTARPRIVGPEDAKSFTHDNSIDMTMSGCSFLRSAWEFVGGFYPPAQRTSIHDDRDFQMRVCCFFPIGISSEVSAFWRTDSSQGRGTN